MTRIITLLTIHHEAGRAAAVIAMAGVASILKRHRIPWWISPDSSQGITIMAKVPKDMPEATLADLMVTYTMPAEHITPQTLGGPPDQSSQTL